MAETKTSSATWLPAEDAALVAAYAAGGFAAVKLAFPKRTIRSCRLRYWELGGQIASSQASQQAAMPRPLSVVSEVWTSDEDALFIAAYREGGLAEVRRRLPERSPRECARRLAKLRHGGVPGLENIVKPKTTTKEDGAAPAFVAADFSASALQRMATQIDCIAPFNTQKKGLTQYVQRPDFADQYEFIRRRLLFEINAMAGQLNLPVEVVARSVQVLGAYDFLPGQSHRPPAQ